MLGQKSVINTVPQTFPMWVQFYFETDLPSIFYEHEPKNQICRESLFCFWAHCLEQSALVRQIDFDSDWLQTQPEVTSFNCAFN